MNKERWKALLRHKWTKRAVGLSLLLKIALLIAAAVGVSTRADAQPAGGDLAPVAAEDLGRAARASDLTDCFWAATISPSTSSRLLPDSHAA